MEIIFKQIGIIVFLLSLKNREEKKEEREKKNTYEGIGQNSIDKKKNINNQ